MLVTDSSLSRVVIMLLWWWCD